MFRTTGRHLEQGENIIVVDSTNANEFSSILKEVENRTTVLLNIGAVDLTEIITVRANNVKVIGNLFNDRTTISCGEANARLELG